MKANKLPNLDALGARRKRENDGPPCAYKKRYETRSGARTEAAFILRKAKRNGEKLGDIEVVYCRFCEGWHVGRPIIDSRLAARWAKVNGLYGL